MFGFVKNDNGIVQIANRIFEIRLYNLFLTSSEAHTRNKERTDVIVDYKGEQFVIELKIWRGNAYNERGEKQLSDYLAYYHLKKGYMLSFCFNTTLQLF